MIGLDTNVLVRYIVQDDPAHAACASDLIESLSGTSPGFVTIVSVVELVWVLQRCYQATRREVADVLETLLRSKDIVLENADLLWQALRCYTASSADFSDSLIERSAHAAGCEYTLTFDRNAASTVGMRLIKTEVG